ncbi:hypothetical protein [Stappia sp.]
MRTLASIFDRIDDLCAFAIVVAGAFVAIISMPAVLDPLLEVLP